jgi:hypothetical protein
VEFKKLFTPIKIKNMELRNLIVMLPMSTGFDETVSTAGERFTASIVQDKSGHLLFLTCQWADCSIFLKVLKLGEENERPFYR